MRIARTFAASLAALSVCLVATSVNAALTPTDKPSTPNSVTVIYDPGSKEMSLDVGGRGATTFELTAAAGGGTFNVDNAIAAGWKTGFPEQVTASKLFALDAAGFLNRSMGVQDGFDVATMASVLSASGSYKDAPRAFENTFLHIVPEPSSIALLALGLVGLMGLRRR